MFKRTLQAEIKSHQKSILLLGPRQTGKSTLIQSLAPELTINLANERTFLSYLRDPGLLEAVLEEKAPKSLFIDEVQRIPSLLNTLQSIIDKKSKLRIFLSGSSARKLRRGHANLLPGRIVTYELFPLSTLEMGDAFDFQEALTWGLLPGIVTEKDEKIKRKILNSYSSTYLKEEIQAEALTKNLEGFSRFLYVAASWSGKTLDFSKMASQSEIEKKSATRFFEILEDTLVVKHLPAFSRSQVRRLAQHPRFYFFDVGVLNSLLGNYQISDDRKGSLFEHLIINQAFALASYAGGESRLSYYRTESGAEVDLIIETPSEILAIEVKSSKKIGSQDLRGLKSFEDFVGKKVKKMVLCEVEIARQIDGVHIFPWAEGLEKISKSIAN